jgi:tetratricopeptide (TPR) repeat protein
MKISARIKLLSICIIGLLTVPPSMAFAGPEEAAAYYEEASQAYQDGDYEKAARLLRRAFAEDSNLIYKYNRILALQAMGDYDTALEELDIWENRMKEDGRFDDIKEIRAQLEKAKAEADAKEKATADKTDDQKDGNQKDGDKVADGQAVDGPDKVAPADDGPNYLGWSLVGAGAVGLGSAALFGSTLLIDDVEANLTCSENKGAANCYPEGSDASALYQEDYDTWQTHQTITWVSLGIGAVALVGGGAVLLMDASEQDAEADVPVSADNADVSFSPYVGADGAGGVLHISF